MALVTVINQIIVLFLMILVGFFAKKKNIINEESRKKLSELLINITNPLLIISSFQFEFSREILRNVLIVLVFAIVAHIITILISKLLFIKTKGSTKQIAELSTVYTNCGFMGYPVLESLYGKIGILYASVYSAVFNVFLWTHGLMIFNGKKGGSSIKKILINPGIISVIIGMLIFVFSVKLPYPVAQAIGLIGDMTIPLSMLIVGATLADVDFRKLFSGIYLYYITGVRLILMPLLAVITLKLLGFAGVLLGTCVLLIAMPVATTVSIFAEIYDGDIELSSRVVVFSTLLSAFTIPLMIFML